MTEQEWQEEKESTEIGLRMREVFQCYGKINLSLSALRKIEAIVKAEAAR